jgi:ABC-type multidrug transport system fused ATPase/permease subunit
VAGLISDGVIVVKPDMSMLKTQAGYMVLVGLAACIASWSMFTLTSIFAERIVFKVRIDYFRKCLEKDAAFYDENLPTSMASRISKECEAIKTGIGQKSAQIVMAVASFIIGMALAFYWGWMMACLLLVSVPVFMAMGVLMGTIMESGLVAQMKAYALSAGYAEQAL